MNTFNVTDAFYIVVRSIFIKAIFFSIKFYLAFTGATLWLALQSSFSLCKTG